MSGNATVTLLQTGTLLTGRMDLANVLEFNGSCTPTTGDSTSAVLGTLNGSNVEWHGTGDTTEFTGTIDGDHLSATMSDSSSGGTGTITLTRASASATADATGAWAGSYSFVDTCANGSKKTYTGQLTLGLRQSSGAVSGVATLKSVPLYDRNCSTLALLDQSMTVAGIVNGSTLNASVYDPAGSFDFDITAAISGGTLSGSVAGPSLTSTTGTFTATSSSTSAPASDFTGSFIGNYNETDDVRSICLNLAFLQFQGPALISIVQAGNAVSGVVIFQNSLSASSDGFGNCSILNVGDSAIPLYGTIDSTNTLTLLNPLGNGQAIQVIVKLGANDLTGTVADTFGDSASFTATRATSVLPSVAVFGASPPVITQGGTTTLFWSVADATSVTIDNGVGSQPATGSMTVSPSVTTTYTLTAVGSGGVTTAKVTITVAPAQPRRRSVHR